jgi:exodeoxyribonuclease-3
MKLRLATWNINSVRLRIGLVERFVKEFAPDVLCLQEIKCVDELFPYDAVKAMGYPHIHVKGQSGYHGVATLSRLPLTPAGIENFCGTGEARHIASRVEGKPLVINNVYIPAGGDIPDPELNPKFGQKLAFVRALTEWFGEGGGATRDCHHLLAGDFNIAPYEHDVWSHKQLLKVVSHTPIEVEHLSALKDAGNWLDIMRGFVPEEEKLYTWWSYRARDWQASNRGRRLDHVWATPGLDKTAQAMMVIDAARGWEKPSDHVPVIVDFDFSNIAKPAAARAAVKGKAALSAKAGQPKRAGT